MDLDVEKLQKLQEIAKAAMSGLSLEGFKGDVVGFKYVENEFGNIEEGGIGVQNIHYDKKEEKSDSSDDEPTEHLDNIIFRINLFDSDARLTSLRNTIASFVNLGEDNNKLSVAAENQIEPTAQNEWYYILIGVSEAEIVGRNVFTDVNFANQMISWFPWLFHFDTPEEMATFKRKFTKSISAERSLWKYGAKKEVTAIKDMWARQRTLGIDYAKLARLHPVANGLKKALEELKTEIQKAQSST